MKSWKAVVIVAALAGACAYAAPVRSTDGRPSSGDANAASDKIIVVGFSEAMKASTPPSDRRDGQQRELSGANPRQTAFEPGSEPRFPGME